MWYLFSLSNDCRSHVLLRNRSPLVRGELLPHGFSPFASLSVEQRYSHCHKSFLAIRIYHCTVPIQFTMNDIFHKTQPTKPFFRLFSCFQSLQSAVESATKKEKKEAPLKKEGNQEQLDHSKKVSSLIESAIFSHEQVDVDNVKLHLQEALTELTNRQKLIKIADCSPLGWSTVKEYVTDELADDSGDEKRLRKVICFYFPID